MPSQPRWLNLLAALCAVTLVAGVLALFARPDRSDSPGSTRLSVAPPGRVSGTTSTVGGSAAAPTTTPQSATITTGPGATPTTPTTPTTTAATVTTVAPPPPTADPNRRWAVGTVTLTFVDNSRRTTPAGGDPGEASRTLPTVIRYPVDGPASRVELAGGAGSRTGHPFPLLVFAHGYNTTPGAYADLLHFWASAGYVVAAPSFPRATAGGPLDEGDVNNQPGDVSFVITEVLAAAPLAGMIDGAHIGVAGHSDGASTASGIGYNSCCRDSRVAADAVMEGDLHSYPGGSWFPAGSAPALLVIQADHDALNPPALGQAVYDGGRPPKYLLWLLNAQHLEPYTSDAPHLGVVEAVTTAFFDRYLKGRTDAAAAMGHAAIPGLATLKAG